MSVNNNSQEATTTREQLKKERENHNGESLRNKRIRVRLIPVWLRVIIVAVLMVIAICIGAIIGYSVLGDGKPTDVFKKSTWTHIMDIVDKE